MLVEEDRGTENFRKSYLDGLDLLQRKHLFAMGAFCVGVVTDVEPTDIVVGLSSLRLFFSNPRKEEIFGDLKKKDSKIPPQSPGHPTRR